MPTMICSAVELAIRSKSARERRLKTSGTLVKRLPCTRSQSQSPRVQEWPRKHPADSVFCFCT
jgi:hypothetical protein